MTNKKQKQIRTDENNGASAGDGALSDGDLENVAGGSNPATGDGTLVVASASGGSGGGGSSEPPGAGPGGTTSPKGFALLGYRRLW